jgi:dienelactone hydrolase
MNGVSKIRIFRQRVPAHRAAEVRVKVATRWCICAAIAASIALIAPVFTSAEEAAWIAGDMVQVATHRTDLTLLPKPSSRPLMAYLARPIEPGRHPAVIEMHGCAGFGFLDVVVADVLRSFGYVALALDSLGDDFACDTGYGSLAEAFDAYAALDWLVQQTYVDPDRVGLLGFSMGGGAVLDAIAPGLIEDKKPQHFRAAVAYYPWCKDRDGSTTMPTLILIGDRDDWTQASWCQEMAAQRNGSSIELVVYPGATHSFNYPGPPREFFGHHLEYDAKATADAWVQVRRFFTDKLGSH